MSHAHTSKDRELEAKTRFESDTSEHQMTVLLDQGLYRHLLFKQPGSSFYWYEVITTPGALTVMGDMGTWVFRRTEDMFEFFRDGSGLTRINPGYWAEKLQGGHNGGRGLASTYDENLFKQVIEEELAEFFEHGRGADWPEDVQKQLRAEVQADVLTDDYGNTPPSTEALAFDAAYQFRFRTTRSTLAPATMARALGDGTVSTEYEFSFYEPSDWTLRTYSNFFLWVCWAIVHAIESYDAHKAPEHGDPFTPADLGQEAPTGAL